MEENHFDYDAVVIGSGFGGTITALTIAREFYLEGLKDPAKPKRKVLILERGTWWTTPVGTVADKEVAASAFLKKNNQPVQFWSSNNSFRGVIDLLTRCLYRKTNPDGLYQLSRFGLTGILSLFSKSDGVTVLRANGVGGGSLVYSNITVQPPDLVFNDARWSAMNTWLQNKGDYYDAACTAIGTGVLKALVNWDDKHQNPMNYTPAQLDMIKNEPRLHPGVNTGLSQIVTRTAEINPHWKLEKDASGNWDVVKNDAGEKLYQIDTKRYSKNPQSPDLSPLDDKRDFKNDLWVDRARIFQTGMEKLSETISLEYSANTLSINDFDTLPLQVTPANPATKAGDNQFDPTGKAANYCERQGRCNIGCLPGARHALNKQLMLAMLGKADFKRNPDGTLASGAPEIVVIAEGIFKDILFIKPLSEVDYISKVNDNNYKIHYWKHKEQSLKVWKGKTREVLKTPRIIVSAGCLGTSEIMLRSREKGSVQLSNKLGYGFSTNGDNFYLLGQTKERVRSIRGPAQTSHAHFNLTDPGNLKSDTNIFHMIEDLGIPPAFATTIGFGKHLFYKLANGHNKIIIMAYTVIMFIIKKIWSYISGLFLNRVARQDMFKNEDEVSSNFLCVTSTGREQAKAKIKLGGLFETPLRMERKKEDGKTDDPFIKDPVYANIDGTLTHMAGVFADENATDPIDKKFIKLGGDTVGCSHPLGGCHIGANSREGVVDEFGHVFDTSKPDERAIHKGLYIADASIIPTALGVNPSLSISAICWYIAGNIRKEL